jgi:putative flippase GtrA
MFLKNLKPQTMLKSQIMLFFIVGSTATVINYLVFYTFLEFFHIMYIVSSVTGYMAGVLFSYYLNFKYTFSAEKDVIFKKMPIYISVYLLSLLLSSLLLYILVDYLKLAPKLSNIFAILQSSVTNYLGCRYIVFRTNK